MILSKAKGWWAVERDPTGTGSIVPDVSKANWVPAGCLLECLRPPGFSSSSSSSPGSPLNGSFPRMLRLDNILSTSFPGVALMDYQSEKREEEEMGLTKGDVVWVFKRYSHWSYAVKEDTGERGWVCSFPFCLSSFKWVLLIRCFFCLLCGWGNKGPIMVHRLPTIVLHHPILLLLIFVGPDPIYTLSRDPTSTLQYHSVHP